MWSPNQASVSKGESSECERGGDQQCLFPIRIRSIGLYLYISPQCCEVFLYLRSQQERAPSTILKSYLKKYFPSFMRKTQLFGSQGEQSSLLSWQGGYWSRGSGQDHSLVDAEFFPCKVLDRNNSQISIATLLLWVAFPSSSSIVLVHNHVPDKDLSA